MLKIDNGEWQRFSARVYAWSIGNFGKQRSKADPTLELNSLIPLLGIVEEFGEFAEAKNRLAEIDALADMAIYAADYYGREGMSCNVGDAPETACTSLCVEVGKLMRPTIKYHQGIRGYGVLEKYQQDRDTAFIRVLYTLDYVARHLTNDSILALGTEVFTKIVAKRNWTENPVTG